MSLLAMRGISKSFSGVQANDKIALKVEAGEIHALLGENGAGKSTLMNILYGLCPKDSGRILWKGVEAEFASPREALAAGIGMVHQHFALVPTLSVSENITLGLCPDRLLFPRRSAVDKRVRDLSTRYALEIQTDQLVSSLSVGQQQRVEILKVLYRNFDLLILDEPTAVLTPQEADSLFAVLRKLKIEGRSVILITHHIPEVLAVTDRITVLRDGVKVAETETGGISDRELSRLMIGRELAPIKREISSGSSDALLKVKALNLVRKGARRLKNVSLDLASGEILGIAGVDGNGQKELAESVLGIQTPSSGSILFRGENLNHLSTMERKSLGIAYISDDRHKDGMVSGMSVSENFLLNASSLKQYVKRGMLCSENIQKAAQEAVDQYRIKTPDTKIPIGNLSGGNQQKLVLARELKGRPSLVVAFQPSRGLDVGAADFIRKQLVELKQQQSSVLLISTDLEEILALSDRIAVLCRGKVAAVLKNTASIDMPRLGLLMAGKVEK